MKTPLEPAPESKHARSGRATGWWAAGWFVLLLGLHLCAVTRGWHNQNLPGHEFRQAQTALSTYFIQQEHNFSLAYPTPVLGKPWSVPFEFPLYEWSVTGVTDATGWPLVTVARGVSLVCFYLALPALWLLLGALQVERRSRWIVLGFALLCPVHVFYARAFLIETMALMFSLWFLAAFARSLSGGGRGWAVVAAVAGIGAGLVKVTTFAVVLMPAAVAVLVLLWRQWMATDARAKRWRRLLALAGRALGLVAIPVGVSVAWVRFADHVKAMNPAAQFATSANLGAFNFGSWADRMDPALWNGQAANALQGVAGPAVLALGLLALVGARGGRRLALAAVGTFLAPLLVFPVLYKVHDYYFVANAVFLAGGLGLAVAALLMRPGWRWFGMAALVVLPALQAHSYWRHYAEWQAQPNPPGSQLTEILPKITDANDVLIIAGYDWDATIPYHARRRALMFHGGTQDTGLVEKCYAALGGERIGALVLSGAERGNRELLATTCRRFGLDPRPAFGIYDDDVYVPVAVRPSTLEFLRTVPVAALRLPAPAEDEAPWWRGLEVQVAELPPVIRRNFCGFAPEPVRSEATFDYSCTETAGEPLFSMHPTTRLWFRPPARRCHLETSYLIYGGAYEGKAPGERTDGVQFTLYAQRPDRTRRVLFERLLDPAQRESDRGRQTLALDLEFTEGEELVLETTAGPAGNWAYEWAALGSLTVRAAGAPGRPAQQRARRLRKTDWQGAVGGVFNGSSPMESEAQRKPARGERLFAACLLGGLLLFAVWGVAGGWRSRALMGNGFRQTQTAITALFVQREHNFSLAYPTPVLGKPWSIPFEFPLYQWTVAVVSDTTGLSLVKCGRLVSAVCFFLALPALWLLLRRMGLGRLGRAAALGMVLTCPLLIFYARAFLIETMALMFSLWFLQAFVAAVERRSWGWLAVANLAGIGAGLVKVTTFMVYLVPAAVWACWWIRREWRMEATRACSRRIALSRLGGWIAAATALPFAATYAWLRFSDQVKAQNPGARNLVSSSMHGYNFGGWSYRSDPAVWAAHWRTISSEIMPVGTLALLVVLAVLFCRGRRLAWAAGCAGLFLLSPAIFPVLYAWHEYYFTAVAVLPMLGAGLVLGGVIESSMPRWRVWATVLVALALQIQTYLHVHRPQQLEDPRGSNDLAEALRYTTEPDDVLVIAGEDWSSVTPFYARRRALMLRRDMESDWPYVEESFRNLAGEHVAALVLRGTQRQNTHLVDAAAAAFGLDRTPVWRVRDVEVYVPAKRVAEVLGRVAQLGLDEVELCRTEVSKTKEEIVWEDPYLTLRQRQAADAVKLPLVRLSSHFGISAGSLDGRAAVSAHAPTRLWFRAPAGLRTLTVEFAIAPGAYSELRREDATDGVEYVVSAARGPLGRRVLFSRLLRPFDDPADRGWQRETLTVRLEAGEDLLLETLPGPANSINRDWAFWGACELR